MTSHKHCTSATGKHKWERYGPGCKLICIYCDIIILVSKFIVGRYPTYKGVLSEKRR